LADLNEEVECLKSKKISILNIMVKMNMALAAGLLICSIALLGVDTVSFFTSGTSENVEVSTAPVDEIIKTIEISRQNPNSIKLVKADSFPANPVIFFSIEGDAAKYISNINPVRLDKNEAVVPIDLNINLPNCINNILDYSLDKKDDLIKGKIRIKFLNEYINEPAEFEFTREYLLEQYFKGLKEDDKNKKIFAGMDKEQKRGTTSYLAGIIEYAAGFGAWDDDKSQKDDEPKDEKSADASYEKLHMTEEQTSIVDIILPNLKAHLNRLYGMIDDLIDEISAKDEKIEGLNKKVEELEDENSNLKTVITPPAADEGAIPAKEEGNHEDVEEPSKTDGQNKEDEKTPNDKPEDDNAPLKEDETIKDDEKGQDSESSSSSKTAEESLDESGSDEKPSSQAGSSENPAQSILP
jgi:hypothetical protein